jgi:hypothetical protein
MAEMYTKNRKYILAAKYLKMALEAELKHESNNNENSLIYLNSI